MCFLGEAVRVVGHFVLGGDGDRCWMGGRAGCCVRWGQGGSLLCDPVRQSAVGGSGNIMMVWAVHVSACIENIEVVTLIISFIVVNT